MPEDELRRVAFGDLPALGLEALSVAVTGPPRSRLIAAIVLGARGCYAAAATVLHELGRGADPVVASLALSTFASHRRQLGGHAAAFGPDAAALKLVVDLRGGEDRDGLDAAGARTDALLGLAADNLGVGRLSVSRRLLARAEPECWRSRVRLGWVTAETELASGNAEAALEPAERALKLATEAGARRHVVKSQLVLAAALGATGDRDRACPLVEEALGVTDEFELRSLSWPAGLLAAEFRPACGRYRSRVDEVLHAVLRRSDPDGRRLARDSPWVPE
ncbi:hypothetical protein FPZ12_036700 [Amycolatopsis acidicola]|uniref:Tetratricopeptide repeat protein n=1 Tax=Amycolatopsis acidicola TaxID=2596893 RepID=A0A5N0UP29_9PSEU|nr:hypothetical protein [Amycolatopsis acidicola]KAA9152576.1 hypothetical protein FPZ12_036700 [Amycolatopsis acidicola]